MSGHSKWSTIKRKKDKTDRARANVFNKCIKEITVAAKQGGGDVENNARLRLAVQNAKTNNMPTKNIQNAVLKGTGELPGVSYDELSYEGYGPFGVAVLIEVLTDNKIRTVAEIRHIFSKAGGNLGETNCVAWMFDSLGQILIRSDLSEETLMDLAIDSGAEEVDSLEETSLLSCQAQDIDSVRLALESRKIEIIEASVEKRAKNTIKVENQEDAKRLLNFIELLEDHDDVQKVYANYDIEEQLMESL